MYKPARCDCSTYSDDNLDQVVEEVSAGFAAQMLNTCQIVSLCNRTAIVALALSMAQVCDISSFTAEEADASIDEAATFAKALLDRRRRTIETAGVQ